MCVEKSAEIQAMDNLPNVCEATSQSHDLDLDNYRPTHRKGKKLLAEKKRRARINNCLMRIRDLVCDGEEEKDTDIDKMEKAEILEKTLEVLTRVRHEYNDPQKSSTFSTRKAMAVRYASGFSSCAEESIRYIQNSRLVPTEVKVQLQNHLRAIARRMEAVVQVDSQGMNFTPAVYPTPSSALVPSSATLSLTSEMLPSAATEDSGYLSVEKGPGQVQRLNDIPEVRGYYIPSPIHSSTPMLPQQLRHASETPLIYHADHERKNYTPDTSTRQGRIEYPQTSSGRRLSDSSEIEIQKHSISSQPSTSQCSTAVKKDSAFSSVLSGEQKLSSSSVSTAPYPFSMPASSSSLPTVTSSVILHPTPVFPAAPFPPDQPFYSYHGYEPYPTVPSILVQPVQYVTTPLRQSPALATTVAKQPSTPSNAIDLCVKRTEDHQISPEAMWRPW